jgi:hypothetical protein
LIEKKRLRRTLSVDKLATVPETLTITVATEPHPDMEMEEWTFPEKHQI